MKREVINVYDVGACYREDKADCFGKKISLWVCDLLHNGTIVGKLQHKEKIKLKKFIRIWLNAHTLK